MEYDIREPRMETTNLFRLRLLQGDLDIHFHCASIIIKRIGDDKFRFSFGTDKGETLLHVGDFALGLGDSITLVESEGVKFDVCANIDIR